MGKKLVLYKNNSKLTTSRKVKTFFGSMGDTYKGSSNFRNCKGVQDTFPKKSKIGESSPNAKHGSGTSSSNTSGVEIMLKKGIIQQTEHQAGEFLSNIFLVGK